MFQFVFILFYYILFYCCGAVCVMLALLRLLGFVLRGLTFFYFVSFVQFVFNCFGPSSVFVSVCLFVCSVPFRPSLITI